MEQLNEEKRNQTSPSAPAGDADPSPQAQQRADHPTSKSARRRRRRRKRRAQNVSSAQPSPQAAAQPEPAGESPAKTGGPAPQPEMTEKHPAPEEPAAPESHAPGDLPGEPAAPEEAPAEQPPAPPAEVPAPEEPLVENGRPEPAEADTAPPPDKTDQEPEGAVCATPAASPVLPAAPETPPAWPVDVPDQEEPAAPDEEERVAKMSRTVQMSIEQILSRAAEESAAGGNAAPSPEGADAEEPEPEDAEPEDAEPEDAEPANLPARLKGWALGAATGMARWLALVAVLIALIAGLGLGWLYSRATPDMIPTLQVSFGGQTLETAAYEWRIPVVGNQIKRTYADTITSDPVPLDQPVETAAPGLVISPQGYTATVSIWDEAGVQVFQGSAVSFSSFRFDTNGTYTAEITVGTEEGGRQDATVTGSQTYRFQFEVALRPSFRLNVRTVRQGGVVAVRVSDTQTDAVPTMTSTLGGSAFYQDGDIWTAYLPVSCDQQPGGYTVTVTADGYTETLELQVTNGNFGSLDLSSRSSRSWPFLGPEDTPAEVETLLDVADSELYWTQSGFVQPSMRSMGVELGYGQREYVGRSSHERVADIDNGTARVAENTVVATQRGEQLICPADGRVLLAENLGGTAGNTVVIEHGAGIKSIFYCLGALDVKKGDTVRQGDPMATAGSHTILEVRVGKVAVEPLSVLRNECDALKVR